jgi:hypothetical protein
VSVLLPHRHHYAAALRGKLHRILDQIRDDLDQTISIRPDHQRGRRNNRLQCLPFGLSQQPQLLNHIRHTVPQIDFDGNEIQPPGLNPRTIQQVLDHADQPV